MGCSSSTVASAVTIVDIEVGDGDRGGCGADMFFLKTKKFIHTKHKDASWEA